MATRIEFSKHGGPEVLNAVEFTPNAPAENEVQVENKAILSTAVAAKRPGHRSRGRGQPGRRQR